MRFLYSEIHFYEQTSCTEYSPRSNCLIFEMDEICRWQMKSKLFWMKSCYNDNRKSKFKVFRRQIRDLQANSLMEFVDFCCNDIVSKSLIDFLVRLNHQPRKGLLPFRHTIIIIAGLYEYERLDRRKIGQAFFVYLSIIRQSRISSRSDFIQTCLDLFRCKRISL